MGSSTWTALGCDPRQGAAGGGNRHRRGTGYGFAVGSSATALGGGGAGKVIEGLTVKQEISAIREALHSDDDEFINQYGGLQGAVERYKELMMLPEAAALPKGVSIDGYSTFRATRFSETV